MRHLDDYKCVKMLGDLGSKEAIKPLEEYLANSSNEYLNCRIRLALRGCQPPITATSRNDSWRSWKTL